MKKLINHFIALILLNLLLVNLQAQTFTHGAGAINTNGGVGTAGTDHTFIGAGAGGSNVASGNSNSFIGYMAGNGNVDQDHNTFVGWHSGILNGSSDGEHKANNNTFLGSLSGASNLAGGNNTFIGVLAGFSNIGGGGVGDANVYLGFSSGFSGNGVNNCLIGTNSGYSNTGSGNVFVGNSSGYGNTSGEYNSVFGTEAAFYNETGQYNTTMGFHAGYGSSGNNYSGNSFFGCFAGASTLTGGNNVFMGYNSGSANTSGVSNVFLGYSSGVSNTTGSSNTIIGYSANVGSSGLSNASAFGANAIVKNSNHMILGDNSTKVGINLSNDATGPLSVLSVGGNGSSTVATYSFNPSVSDGNYSIKGEINTPASNSSNKLYATAGYTNAGNGYGFGVIGWSYKSTTSANGRTYGVYGLAGNCALNYGVYGVVTGTTGTNYAIYGQVASSTGYAGYFDGLVRTTNDSPEKPSSGSWTGYSDQRLKKDITPFNDGLAVLREINPVTYKFNGIGGLDETQTHIGVIAQEVQPVAPYCVGSTTLRIDQADGGAFSSDIISTISDSTQEYIVNVLNYNQDGLFYAMINAIKQLDSTVTSLQEQINEGNESLRTGNSQVDSSALPTQHVTLASGKAILYQNTPNPAGDQTTIGYYLSEGTTSAEMIFYDMYGKEIKRVSLENRGNATLDVNTKDLEAGIYTYSLVVNGTVIDTLRFVRTR